MAGLEGVLSDVPFSRPAPVEHVANAVGQAGVDGVPESNLGEVAVTTKRNLRQEVYTPTQDPAIKRGAPEP
jgi:hypothetical protein